MNLLALPDAHVTVDWLLRTSLQVALLVAVVTLVTTLAGRRLSPGCRYALWLLVAVRLALPVLPASGWSAFNLLGSDAPRAVVTNSAELAQPETGWIITKDPLPAAPPRVIGKIDANDVAEWSWRHLVLLLWGVGVVGFLTRILITNVAFARRVRRGTGVDDAGVLALLCACQHEMNVRRQVRIVETDAVNGPALWGLTRPAMLLPPGMLRALSRDDLRFVFLHELAHLKRCDTALDWCLALLHAVHWFNPAAWFALARLRAERELSRDAMVLAVTHPHDERLYGETILTLVKAISRPRTLWPGTVGIVEDKRELKRRIAMIAGFDRRSPRGRALAGALSLLIAFTLLTDKRVAFAETRAQPAETGEGRRLPPVPAVDQSPAQQQQQQQSPTARAEANAAAEQRLARTVPELRFVAVTLGEVIEFLRDITGADIFVNWAALEQAGLNRRTTLVTANMRNLPLSAALEQILEQAGGDRAKLDFTVRDGVITITTADDLAADTDIQVYDVRDLLEVEEKDERQATTKREALVKELTTLITETIDPPSWKTFGSIRHLSGQLIITATRRNHAQVIRLLDKLRESRAIQISLEVRFITATPELIKQHRIGLGEGKGIEFMGDEQMAAIVRTLQGDENSTFLTAPRVTLANGQKGSVKVLQQNPYVADFKEVNGEFRPQVATQSSGVVFVVAATSSSDRKYVTLDVHPQVTQLLELTEVPWKHAPPGRNDLNVQVPREVKQEAKAVVSVPNGGTMALLLEPALVGAGKAPEQRLVMFVKPTILVRPPAEQKPYPLLNERKKTVP